MVRGACRGCHPLSSLVLARVREFVREPAAIFWVYVFPVVLVVTLGAAFRNRPAEAFRVGVLQGEQAERVAAARTATGDFARASAASRKGGWTCGLGGPTCWWRLGKERRRGWSTFSTLPGRRANWRETPPTICCKGLPAAATSPRRGTTRSTSRAGGTSISSSPACWGWA